MTREEHISNLETIGCDGWTVTTEAYKSLQFAIKVLEQEPCEDCISRKAVLDCLTASGLKKFDFLLDARDKIKNLPSITPKPKTGHWEQYGYSWEDKFKCSECGKKQRKILCGERIVGDWSDYCPNCGARMSESKYVAEWAESFAQGLKQGLQDGFSEREDKG